MIYNNDIRKSFGRIFQHESGYALIFDNKLPSFSYYQFATDILVKHFTKGIQQVVILDSSILTS